MKCWYSAFNAQGSRLIIVVVQLGALKISVAAVEALRKKKRQDETQFTTKIDGFLSFIPYWMLVYFLQVFKNITLCMTKLRVLVLCFSYFADNSIINLGIYIHLSVGSQTIFKWPKPKALWFFKIFKQLELEVIKIIK